MSADTDPDGRHTDEEPTEKGSALSAGALVPAEPPMPEAPRLLVMPPIDIYETPEGLTLVADMPGVAGDGVDVQVQDNKLTLYGRATAAVPDDAIAVHREFPEADFLRSFILSDDVDHDRIEASLTGGVLSVSLPRVPRSKPRKIDVSVD